MNDIVELISSLSTCDRNVNRESIQRYEEFALTQTQVEIPPSHLISGGMYARQIVIPAGTVLTGDIYKFDHIDIMVSGRIIVSTDDGDVRELSGFNMFPSQSGKKRAGYAVEDTTWITVNNIPAGSYSNGDEIQKAVTVSDFDELSDFYATVSNLDYEILINEFNLDPDAVQRESDNEQDYCENQSFNGYELKESKIHGTGLFAKDFFEAGEAIGVARKCGIRTELGRYTNHSVRPNAMYVIEGDNVMLVALSRIYSRDEITTNYRHTLNMRSLRGDLCQE